MITVDEIGTLNRLVNIMQYSEAADEYGFTHQELVDAVGNAVWARIEPARGRTYYEQYKDKVETLIKITIRYRPGISEDMVVSYKDRLYKIMSVVDPYEAHIKLELMCNLKRLGGGGASDED